MNSRLFAYTTDGEIVTVDREFRSLVMSKMGALWLSWATLKGQGDMWDVEDFRVKYATVTQDRDTKGVVVEVRRDPPLSPRL